MDFKRKLKEGESETLSFISSFDNEFEILASISGMSNSKGGNIYIGVNSKGKILGINHLNIDLLIDQLLDAFNSKIAFSFELSLINYKYVCVLSIKEAKTKPLSFKLNNDSISFVRHLDKNYRLNTILFKALNNTSYLTSEIGFNQEDKLIEIFQEFKELSFSKLKSLSGFRIDDIENTLIKLINEKKIDFNFTKDGVIIYKYKGLNTIN